MKRQLLTLTLSILAANAFALPAAEQHLTAESRSSAVEIAQPLKTVAEGGSDRLIEQSGRVAEGGSDRLIEQSGRVQGGSDRLIEQSGRVAKVVRIASSNSPAAWPKVVRIAWLQSAT